MGTIGQLTIGDDDPTASFDLVDEPIVGESFLAAVIVKQQWKAMP